MAIRFNCAGCGKEFTVADNLAGKRARCNHCGQPVQIPELETPASPPQENDLPKDPPPVAPEPPKRSVPPPVPEQMPEAPPPASVPPPPPADPPAAAADPAQAVAAPPVAPGTQPSAPPVAPPAAEPLPAAASTAGPRSDGLRRMGTCVLDFLLFRIQITTSLTIGIWALMWAVTIPLAINHTELAEWIPLPAAEAWFWLAVFGVLVLERILCEGFVILHRINNSTTDVAHSLGFRRGTAAGAARITGRWLWEVFTLQSLVFVLVVQIVWIIGTIYLLFMPSAGLILEYLAPGNALGVVSRLVMVVLWRTACEGMVVGYRISETVSEVLRREGFARPKGSLGAFVAFRFLVTPWLVRLVWFVGLVALPYVVFAKSELLAPVLPENLAILGLVAGIILLRLFCETVIATYAIHESFEGLAALVAARYKAQKTDEYQEPPGLLFFRSMITPGLIQFVWLLGSLAILAGPAVLAALEDKPESLAWTIPAALFAFLAFRLNCEGLIVVFSINESVGATAEAVRSAQGSPPADGAAWIVDFVTFRTMWAPVLVQILWVLGLLACFLGSVYGITQAVKAERPEDGALIFGCALAGLLVFRILCEFVIVTFSINKLLSWIRNTLGRTA